MSYRLGSLDGTTQPEIDAMVANARATIVEMYRTGQAVTAMTFNKLLPRSAFAHPQQRSDAIDALKKLDPGREARLEAGKRTLAIGRPVSYSAAAAPAVAIAAVTVPGFSPLVAAGVTAAAARLDVQPAPPRITLLPSPTAALPMVATPQNTARLDQAIAADWMLPLAIAVAIGLVVFGSRR